MTLFRTNNTLKASLFVLSTGLLASLGGCDLLGSGDKAGGPPPGMGPQMPQVGVLKAEPTQVPNTFTMTGRAESAAIAEIRPQVEGIVIKRNFVEGAMVEKGQVLYELDASSYQALYDNAQAAIGKSEALLTNAKIKVKRNERLVKINAVSEQVLDDARAAVREAKANLEADKAALKTAQINLQRTKIKAPISGLIGRSSVTKGALVTTNQTTSLASIRQLDPIYVDFSVPSYYAIPLKKQIAQGNANVIEQFPITIQFEDGTTYEETGRIKLSEFSVDRSTDSIILRTEFKNKDSILLPGMFIRGSIQTGMIDNVYLVPATVVSRTALGMPYVMILEKDGTVAVRPVKTDRLYQDKWVIKGGLQAGDQIIVKGLQYIRPGVKAGIIGAKKPDAKSPGKPADKAPAQEKGDH